MLQKELAKYSNLDQSYLAGLERGRKDPPRLEILVRILNCLEATSDERESVLRAALISRINKLSESYCCLTAGSDVLIEISSILPFLSPKELEAICVLVKGKQQSIPFRQKEAIM